MITPFLWFDGRAEEAVQLYCSTFKNCRVKETTHYSKASAKVSGRPEGSIMTITFEIDGQEFAALNGGPEFKFTPAISFSVPCESQEEIDRIWGRLTADGGKEVQCGWLEDKFGVSWQIVPAELPELMKQDAERVMQALLPMKKIDLEKLQLAARGSVH